MWKFSPAAALESSLSAELHVGVLYRRNSMLEVYEEWLVEGGTRVLFKLDKHAGR